MSVLSRQMRGAVSPWRSMCSGLMASLVMAGGALAAYPDRAVQVVVPSGSGSADVVPRLAVAQIAENTGHQFVVDNRPGAGGLVGTQYVLRQPADGYNLLVVATNHLVINQFVYQKQGLDPLKELTPVAKLVTVPLIVAVNADLPIRSLEELVAYGRRQNSVLNFSSPGVGTPPHIASESLVHSLGLKGMHIPYQGGVAMATAVASGEVQLTVVAYATLQSVIDAGKVRPIAVVNPQRLAVLPDVPTVTEAGYPQLLEAIPPNWWAITVRAGTPQAVVDDLAGWIKQAMDNPGLQERYRAMGMVPSYEGPAQMAAGLPREANSWKGMVERLQIRAE